MVMAEYKGTYSAVTNSKKALILNIGIDKRWAAKSESIVKQVKLSLQKAVDA
jgi:hypothetical protein